MTRKEAIFKLKDLLIPTTLGSKCVGEFDRPAIDMAIKALEQEPCEDAISRQAVMQTLYDCGCESEIQDAIEKLPPVTLKPHWLRCDILQEFKCSECRVCFRNKSNYCPNCGAKMEGGEG